MALGASLRGFHSSIRPVICVDGTYLKSKYLGTLFIATTLDGNNQVFPLAFGVGPSESDVAWECFLSKLNDVVADIRSLVIVSDRHKSVAKGVAKVFPDALHVACIYHLSQNLVVKKFNVDVIPLFYIAAKAYRIVDFNRMMEKIRIFDNGRVYSYLLEVGFDFWSRAHCRGDRYDVMITNIAECLNGVLRDARSLPITMLMEHIRAKLQTWFHDRRTEALAMTNILTDHWDTIVGDRREKSRNMRVQPISIHEFHIQDGELGGHVDLAGRTCSCRVFDIDKVPYVHACREITHRELPVHSMCSYFYTTEMLILAYAEPIIPVLSLDTWPTFEGQQTLLPPTSRRPSGRPRKRRIPSQGETQSRRLCSRCKHLGHNWKTCQEPIALHPPTGT